MISAEEGAVQAAKKMLVMKSLVELGVGGPRTSLGATVGAMTVKKTCELLMAGSFGGMKMKGSIKSPSLGGSGGKLRRSCGEREQMSAHVPSLKTNKL